MSSNVYYHPEAWGLVEVMELDENEAYQFNKLVLWQHEDGRLFYATDSGCSCPSPFEDYNTIDDLTHLRHNKGAWKAFEDAVMDNYASWDAVEKVEMLRRAKNLLDETDTKTAKKYADIQRRLATNGSLF